MVKLLRKNLFMLFLLLQDKNILKIIWNSCCITFFFWIIFKIRTSILLGLKIVHLLISKRFYFQSFYFWEIIPESKHRVFTLQLSLQKVRKYCFVYLQDRIYFSSPHFKVVFFESVFEYSINKSSFQNNSFMLYLL